MRLRIHASSAALAVLLLALALPAQPSPAPARDPALIELGRDNWAQPWVPDLLAGEGRRPFAADKRPDVLILGDGYLADERDRFERDLTGWYEKFLALTPWSQLRGAIRVRGYWTPSAGRATAAGESYFGLDGTTPAEDTAAKVFALLERTECNLATRGPTHTHATVVMLIRDSRGRNPSGRTRGLRRPGHRTEVRVAYGAYPPHEFGHAHGGLRDEYIRGIETRGIGRTPARLSIHSLSNLSYTRDPTRIPWRHLMPGTAINPDADSAIGVLWIGGVGELGVWHSEGRCMMNGTHENWDFAKTRRGVGLRDRDRFCFWCEEIIVARTWERTGQFGELTDGREMYEVWARDIRPHYQAYFAVAERIAARNEANRLESWRDAKLIEAPSSGN